jgi:hypothetical protein
MRRQSTKWGFKHEAAKTQIQGMQQDTLIIRKLIINDRILRKENVTTWLERFVEVHDNELFKKASWQGLKIAILDTGICDRAPRIDQAGARKQIEWKDFVENKSQWVDEDGHGTHCATLLMRLLGRSHFSAANSKLYIARVGRNRETFGSDCSSAERVKQVCGGIVVSSSSGHVDLATRSVLDRQAVELTSLQAIEHAASEWNVDIITMSLGFDTPDAGIKTQIEANLNKIIFFAAASNDGLNSPEMFPAHLDNVIAVRGTNTAGDFIRQYNPACSTQYTFGAPSMDVPSNWLNGQREHVLSGSSVATPIAVAFGTVMIRLVTTMVHEKKLPDSVLQEIRRWQCLDEIFRNFQEMQGLVMTGKCFLSPMNFFSAQYSDNDRLVDILMAVRKARRR